MKPISYGQNDNSSVVNQLRLLNKRTELALSNTPSNWCYTNLRITNLEKAFFTCYSRAHNSSNTRMFRRYIQALMSRNPDLVDDAKALIEEEEYDNSVGRSG